jgi:hypothetical protein
MSVERRSPGTHILGNSSRRDTKGGFVLRKFSISALLDGPCSATSSAARTDQACRSMPRPAGDGFVLRKYCATSFSLPSDRFQSRRSFEQFGERCVRISSVSVDRRAPPRLPWSAHGGPNPPPGRGHCRSCVRNTFCLVSTRGLVNDLIARKPVPPAPSKHRLVGVHEHQSKAGQQTAAMSNGCLTTSLESSPRSGS